jgi:hypothetical protein
MKIADHRPRSPSRVESRSESETRIEADNCLPSESSPFRKVKQPKYSH